MALNCHADRGSLNSMFKGIVYQYKIGGKYYVGKTYGLERKRIDKHKYEAFTLKSQRPFQRAIRKYGWDECLKGYSVIETVYAETKEELNRVLIEREKFWIRERNSLVPNGYNVLSSGQVDIPHTANKEEIYARISNTLKQKYQNEDAPGRPVFCFEQNRWYSSVSKAERDNHIAKGSIGKAAAGVNCSAGGLTWSFTGEKAQRADQIKALRKPIICIETGETYPSIYGAAKAIFGDKAMSKKPNLQAAVKHGWAVNGKHYRFIEQDNPVPS